MLKLHVSRDTLAARQKGYEAAFLSGMLAKFPVPWQPKVRAHFEGLERGFVQNRWLYDAADKVGAIRVPITIGDDDLCQLADRCAAEAMGRHAAVNDLAGLRESMARYVAQFGIKPPEQERVTKNGTKAGVSDRGAVARMSCPQWWRRKLREYQARAIEACAIDFGYVHRKAECYASSVTVERRGQQRRRNAKCLENTQAVNLDNGEIFRLSELAAVSVANPRIRRGELMTRLAGFEAIADGLGHVAEFVTQTCPSKYHPTKTVDNKPEQNPKYNGATPRKAQGYLSKTWQLIRAKLARLGVRFYGFRIAEPHHDGCPHWHSILFTQAGDVERLRSVIRSYAMREDGSEAGALEHRVTFETIDRAKGSAVAYVAKYISKNIDGGGFQVQGDFETGGAVVASERVEAWASTWGIRQFQQVGGAPVGVWRELRRLAKGGEYSPVVEAARAAADCGQNGRDETGSRGNWRRYCEVQGGAFVRRADLALRVAYTRPGERYSYKDDECYPANKTRYGEEAAKAVFGVLEQATGAAVPSVRYRWEIKSERKNLGVGDSVVVSARGGGYSAVGSFGGGEFGCGVFRVDSGVGESESAGGSDSGGLGISGSGVGFDSPWIHVNNCTGDDDATAATNDISGRESAADYAEYADALSDDGRGLHEADGFGDFGDQCRDSVHFEGYRVGEYGEC